jgi:hypothetical protein
MTSWGGNRQFAQAKKFQESIQFFQTTEGGFCSNMTSLFIAYANAVKTSSSLYVHDVPNSVSQNLPLFQSILKDNSTVKYLKDVSPNSTSIDWNKMKYDFQTLNGSTNFTTLKRMAKDLFFYNGDAQEKIMSRIRGAGLDRTLFDVGVHIRSGDKITRGEMKAIPIQDYVSALNSYSKRLGKPKLSVFVMTDNMKVFEELKRLSPATWTFTTLQNISAYTANGHTQSSFNTLPSSTRLELFYQFLTELHIMQNIPNLVVTYSSNIGRFLYLTSRFQHTADSIMSLDVQQWSLV